MLLPLDQIIAWAMTIVAFTLFIVERKKNDKKPIYMALQGLVKSTYAKYKSHKAHFGILSYHMGNNSRQFTMSEYALYSQMVQTELESQIEQLVGIMESLGLGETVVFESETFTHHKADNKEFYMQMKNIQNNKSEAE